MRLMRRTGLVAFVTALVVLISSPPAHAVDLIDEVDAVKSLPSTAVKAWHSAAGGIGDQQLKFFGWLVAQAKSSGPAAPPAAAAIADAVPLTAPAPLAKAGASSNLLVGAFSAGWMITDGTLALYSTVTGDEALQGACRQPAWAQAGISVLYPFSMPDCVVGVTVPNSDATQGWTKLSGAAGTLEYLGQFQGTHCYRVTPANVNPNAVGGSGTNVGVRNAQGAMTSIGFGSYPSRCPGTTSQGYWFATPSPPVYIYTGTMASPNIQGSMTQSSADPSRSIDCKLTWPDGTTTTGSGGTFKESAGLAPSGIDKGCRDAFVSKPGAGPGLLPSTIDVGTIREDTGARTEISKQTVPSFSESEKVGLTPGDNTGLRLLKVVQGAVQSCMSWEADCVSWWTQTAEGTSPTVDSGTYRCQFGGRDVALAECGVYRQTFDTKTNTPTITDPTTGQQVGWSSSKDPANTPGTGGQAGQSNEQCVVSFTLNPVDWVMRPLRCLFEPRQSVVTAAQNGVTTAWTNSAVGAWSIALGGWNFDPPPSGCAGILLPLDVWFGHDVQPIRLLNACPGEPLAPAAAISTLVITILSGIGLVRSATRSLGGLVGTRGLGD